MSELVEPGQGLGKYKGYQITGTSIVVTNLGDGLSKAVDVEPLVVKLGDRAYVAVEVKKVNDKYVLEVDNKTQQVVGVELVQTFSAMAATFADPALVAEAIDVMTERIKTLEDERAGRLTLGIGDLDEARAKKKAVDG